MPHLLDSRSRTDAVLAGACALILREGVRALTLRGMAREARISPASLVHHFSSAERLDRVLGRHFAHLWSERQAFASTSRGLHALVPRDDEERDEARIWLAWCEVARARPSLAPAIAGVRADQRRLVGALIGGGRDPVDVDLALAVVEGITTACCAPSEPLDLTRAEAVVTRLLGYLEPGLPQRDR